MSTNNTETHEKIESFPTDGEERDYEAAAKTMNLRNQSVFRINDSVFEYQGLICGEAVVDRLSEPKLSDNERIPMTELWEAYQRGSLELGKWQCEFVAENGSSTNNDKNEYTER